MWNTYWNEFINKLTVLISIATGCRGVKRRDNLVVWPTEIETACAFRGCEAIIRCNIGKGLNRIVNSLIYSWVYLEIDNGDDNLPWSVFDGLVDYSYFLTYISIVGHLPLNLPTGFKAIIRIFPHPKLCTPTPLLSSPVSFTRVLFPSPGNVCTHCYPKILFNDSFSSDPSHSPYLQNGSHPLTTMPSHPHLEIKPSKLPFIPTPKTKHLRVLQVMKKLNRFLHHFYLIFCSLSLMVALHLSKPRRILFQNHQCSPYCQIQ